MMSIKAKAAQHTPGPWQWNRDECEISTAGPLDWDRRRIATVLGFGPETDANARLLAVAPDLLNAAKVLLDVYASGRSIEANEAWVLLAQAVAKTEDRAALNGGG